MPWDRALNQPIVLKDGRAAATLEEARELVRSIPLRYRQGAVWHYLSELMNEAANDRATVDEVSEVLSRGLRGAGLL